jgi:hypothetical protein
MLIIIRHCYWWRGQTRTGTSSKLQLPVFVSQETNNVTGNESAVQGLQNQSLGAPAAVDVLIMRLENEQL